VAFKAILTAIVLAAAVGSLVRAAPTGCLGCAAVALWGYA
jgi:hypothetical protein